MGWDDRPPTARRDGPDARPHPRLDGGGRGRAQHRARLPAGRERLDRRAGRAGQGRRASTAASTPRTSATTRSASRPPTASRSRSAGARASPSASRTSRSTTRPSRCSRRPARPASTSASTGTSTPRARATCSSGCRPRTSSAASTRPSSGLRDDPAHRAQGRARSSRSRSRSPTPSAAASTSRTRGPGATSGCRSAEVAAERGTSVGETAVDLIIEESPDAILVFRRGISPEDVRRPGPADAQPPGVHGRQRRRLPRGAPPPARLRLLRPGARHVRARARPGQPRAGGPPDERPAGRALRDHATADASPRASPRTSSCSIRRPSGPAPPGTSRADRPPASTRSSSTARSSRAMVDRPTPDRVSSFVRGTVTEVAIGPRLDSTHLHCTLVDGAGP